MGIPFERSRVVYVSFIMVHRKRSFSFCFPPLPTPYPIYKTDMRNVKYRKHRFIIIRIIMAQ